MMLEAAKVNSLGRLATQLCQFIGRPMNEITEKSIISAEAIISIGRMHKSTEGHYIAIACEYSTVKYCGQV